jgi:hypothetical protein
MGAGTGYLVFSHFAALFYFFFFFFLYSQKKKEKRADCVLSTIVSQRAEKVRGTQMRRF